MGLIADGGGDFNVVDVLDVTVDSVIIGSTVVVVSCASAGTASSISTIILFNWETIPLPLQ